MELKDLIRQAREAKGWRQEDLAERLSVTKQAVQQWESGETSPRGARRARLCDALGLLETDMEAFSAGESFTRTAIDELVHINTEIAALQKLAEEDPTEQRMQISLHQLRNRKAMLERKMHETQAQTTIRRNAPQVHRPFGAEVIQELRRRMPEPYRQYAGETIVVRGARLPYSYVGKKVVAQTTYGTPNGASNSLTRSIAWRLAVAMHGRGDVPLKDAHYLLGVIELPNGIDTNRVHPSIIAECGIVGINIETFNDLDGFVTRVLELENKPTEAAEVFASMQYSPDEDYGDLL